MVTTGLIHTTPKGQGKRCQRPRFCEWYNNPLTVPLEKHNLTVNLMLLLISFAIMKILVRFIYFILFQEQIHQEKKYYVVPQSIDLVVEDGQRYFVLIGTIEIFDQCEPCSLYVCQNDTLI